MKFATRLALALTLFVPTLSFANQHINITNIGGKLTASASGLEITGSEITAIQGPPLGLITGKLGAFSLSTGPLLTGDLQNGGTFDGAAVLVSTNGTHSLPHATFFSGVITGPVTWEMVTLPNGTHNYTLTGTMSGTTFNGVSVNGVSVQLTVNTGKEFFSGTTNIAGGATNITGKGVSETP